MPDKRPIIRFFDGLGRRSVIRVAAASTAVAWRVTEIAGLLLEQADGNLEEAERLMLRAVALRPMDAVSARCPFTGNPDL